MSEAIDQDAHERELREAGQLLAMQIDDFKGEEIDPEDEPDLYLPLSAAKALYISLTIAQAEIEALRAWRDAVDDALVQHMTTAASFPDARAAVRWLIEREQQMALDPAISADARKLVDAETEALRARVAELEGALKPFAENAEFVDFLASEDHHFVERPQRAGDYRRARTTLGEQP